MTTPANLTIDQITTRVMNQLRIPVSNTTEQTKVLALINEVYRDLYVKFDWWFLLKRAVVNTVAKIDTGTVSVTLGSTALTFSSAPGLITHYSFLTPGGGPDFGAVYIVASTGTGTTQALDAAYTNTTRTGSRCLPTPARSSGSSASASAFRFARWDPRRWMGSRSWIPRKASRRRGPSPIS